MAELFKLYNTLKTNFQNRLSYQVAYTTLPTFNYQLRTYSKQGTPWCDAYRYNNIDKTEMVTELHADHNQYRNCLAQRNI